MGTQAFLDDLEKAEVGPKLARYDLSTLLRTVWSSLDFGMIDDEAVAESYFHLIIKWLEAMRLGDSDCFRATADLLDLIKVEPEQSKPQYYARLDRALIWYFGMHRDAPPPTIKQLVEHCVALGLDEYDDARALERNIRNRCKKLELNFTKRSRGRSMTCTVRENRS